MWKKIKDIYNKHSVIFVVVLVIIAAIVLYKIISSTLSDPFWNIIDGASNLVGFITLGISFRTWIMVQNLRKKSIVAKYPKEMEKGIILVMDLGKSNILPQVMDYCNEHLQSIVSSKFDYPQRFDDINKKFSENEFHISCPGEQYGRTVLVSSNELNLSNENITDHFYHILGELKSALQDNVVATIHVFYRGPLVLPFYIGEIFSNSFSTYIYYHLSAPAGSNHADSGYVLSGIMNSNYYLKDNTADV